ncbi:MAG: 4-(cytidine 5'-diphospho)-2-C-methyl-D-erythritol kinase [Actinomycetota bacterium]
MRLRTHAKLNLFLRVVGKRADGYHDIESIFHGIDLADDIEITETRGHAVDVEMHFDADGMGKAPALEENLVYRAARSLIEQGEAGRGVKIEVIKRIPIGGGLGGGSGNAAGALLALSRLWGMALERERLFDLAGAIGSDVTYCIDGGTALATARGEQLTQIPAPRQMSFVLGISREPLLTRDVYGAWDELGPEQEVTSSMMAPALGAGDVHEVALLLHNDLERPAFMLRSDLARKKDAMFEAGVLGAGMTGSGPTMFGILEDDDAAREVAEKVRPDFDRVVVVRSTPHCVEFLG